MAEANAGSIRAEILLSTKDWDRKQRRVKGDLNEMQGRSKKAAKAMRLLKGGMLATAVGAGVAAKASLDLARRFESSMAEVQAVTQAPQAELDKLAEKAKEMGATTKFSSNEAADALIELGRAGMETNDMLVALPEVLSLAAAGSLSLKEAADLSTNVLSAFKLPVEELGRVTDVLSSTAANANTDVQQLSGGMKMVAPVAASMGISLEDTAAALGTLANNGIKSTESGTAVRGMLLALGNPVGQTKKAMD
jgi:TP901 family phage tail tape measure protein